MICDHDEPNRLSAWSVDSRLQPLFLELAVPRQPHPTEASLLNVCTDVANDWRMHMSSPLCGARTRRGTACIMRVEPGRRRCRLHGGRSTGPKTQEGRRRVGEATKLRMLEWWAAKKRGFNSDKSCG